MAARKPVTSLTLSAPQMEWLRAEAARLGISQSDVVRRIVDYARFGAIGSAPRMPKPPEITRVSKPNRF